MSSGKCELRWCNGYGYLVQVFRPVNEDGSSNGEPIKICKRCCADLGVKRGDTLPQAKDCEALITSKRAAFELPEKEWRD